MRILLLCHRQQDITIGGVAEFIHFLPPALKNHHIETVLYTQSEQPSKNLLGPQFLQNGMAHYSGPFLKPSLFVNSKELAPLIELCKKEKIDVIHAQGLYRSGYIALQIYKKIGIPYVITSHSDILATNSERIKRKSVQRRCATILKHAKAVTHLTTFMADASHALFDTRHKSFIIGNGIDTTAWLSSQALPEKNYMFAIGRLEPEKGFHVLIDAFAELMKQDVTTSLVIAGIGSAEKALHDQVIQRGLNLVTDFQDSAALPEKSVIFTGYIRGDLKKQLMKQSKFILFATQPIQWEEPFGIVQIEAMAAGKALIASDTQATRYLQKLGLKALLVQPENSNAWALQMKNLLDDTEQRDIAGKQNLARVSQFDWDIVSKQYTEAYL